MANDQKIHTCERPITDMQILRLAEVLNLDEIFTASNSCLLMRNHHEPHRPGQKNTYLEFTGYDSKNFRYSGVKLGDIDIKELKAMLSAIPIEEVGLQRLITEVEQGFNLEFNAQDERRGEKLFRAARKAQAERDEIMQRVQALPHPEYAQDLPVRKERALMINQGQVGITDEAAKFPILGTYGVSTCVAVILRNPKNNRVALAHMERSSDTDYLKPVIEKLRDNAREPIEVTLWGGRKHESERVITHVVKYLESQPQVKLTHAHVTDTKEDLVSAIAVHADGRIRVEESPRMEPNLYKRASHYHRVPEGKPRDPGYMLMPVTLAYDREKTPLPGIGEQRQRGGRERGG
jgi:hypothetical protein